MKKLKQWLKRPGSFSKIMVLLCIAYCIRVIEWSMAMFQSTSNSPDVILTVTIGFFGTELALHEAGFL